MIQRILELYGEDGLNEGDTLVCNHPYEELSCAGHGTSNTGISG